MSNTGFQGPCVVAGEPARAWPRNYFFDVSGCSEHLSLCPPRGVATHTVPKYGCPQGIGRVSGRSLHVHQSVHLKTNSGKLSRNLPVSLLSRGCSAPVQIDTEASTLTHMKSPYLIPLFQSFPNLKRVSNTWVSRPFTLNLEFLARWFRPCCAANRHQLFFFVKKKKRMNLATLELRHARKCPKLFPDNVTCERFSATAHQHPVDAANEHHQSARYLL